MTGRISGTDARGWRIDVRVGDTVEFTRPDGVVARDVVRDTFIKDYAGGCAPSAPAVVLTSHSWTLLSDIRSVVLR